MAHFRRSVESFSPSRTVTIVGTEVVDDHTVYIVHLAIGLYKWCVRHRYSDFYSLHEKLMQKCSSLDWNLLPKKKLFGSHSEQFIMKRQAELEVYLQSLVRSLPFIPSDLMKFLEFHKYEVHGITETLAETLYDRGDSILETSQVYHMSPLQIHAICARLSLPEPTCESTDLRKDIGHLLDFVTRLKHLQINGSALPVGRSNINMNELSFDLHCFKALTTLQMSGCNIERISDVEHLKKTLLQITVSHSLNSLREILLIGFGRGQVKVCDENTVTLLVQPWTSVLVANFSHNRICHIDESVKLLPLVQTLDLSHNRLDAINNLQHLANLRRLCLAHNLIRNIPALHTKLGNITEIDLSNNKLESLEGLSKLYSLEILNVSSNDVSQIFEVKFVANLPCLEVLDLRNNPVTNTLDYRTTVFEIFSERAKEVMLDGSKATPQEIELVAVRSALNKSREQKHTTQRSARKAHVNEPTISDADAAADSSASTASRASPVADAPVDDASPCSRAVEAVEDESTTSTDVSMLKQKIAHLKETGGSCWLRQLNELLQSESNVDAAQDFHVSVRPEDLTKRDDGAAPPHFPVGHLKLAQRNEMLKRTDGVTGRKLKRSNNIILPETLPNVSDTTFCTHLQTLLPSRSSKELDSEHSQELPIYITWCTTVMYHLKQDVEFPGCVYITNENVHIFMVKSLVGDTGIPQLVRTIRLPLDKVAQIVLGYDGLYLQVEWASSEPRLHGIIALLMFTVGKTDAFINALKLARRRSIPELDDYEDPNVTSGSGLETSLKRALNVYEQLTDPGNIQVLLYMLVMVEGSVSEMVKTSTLVVTSRYIYLINQDYCNTPIPSFVTTLPSDPVFEVAAIFPVGSRVVNVQMYDIDTIESSNNHSLWSTFAKASPGAGSSVGFIGYGVRVSFHLGEYGIQVLDVRMPTSNLREKFLNALVRAHGNVSDSLTSLNLQRLKNASPLRDSDAMSCDSSGSQNSSNRRKEKSGKKNLKGVPKSSKQDSFRTVSSEKVEQSTILDKTSSRPTTFEVKAEVTSIAVTEEPQISTFEKTDESEINESSDFIASSQSLIQHNKAIQATDSKLAEPVSHDFVEIVESHHSATSAVDDGGGTDVKPTQIFLGVENSMNMILVDNSVLINTNNSNNQNDKTRIALTVNPFEAPQIVDEIGTRAVSNSNSLTSSKSSSRSVSPSESTSSIPDETMRSGMEDRGLNHSAHVQVFPQQIVSDSDIAIVRLAVGNAEPTSRVEAVINDLSTPKKKFSTASYENFSHSPGNDLAFPVHSTPKPAALQLGYPSNELLLHLSESFETVPLFPPMSPQFEAFMSMNGLELLNYFHQNIAIISTENEELRHVLWTFVVPYREPALAIPSCVLLSTKAIYFVSDSYSPRPLSQVKSHKRYFSDGISAKPNVKREFEESAKRSNCHPSCGILSSSCSSDRKRVLRAYATILLKDIKQINIGLFSQCIRLTGSDESSVFSCITHDCATSEALLQELKRTLLQFHPLPSPDLTATQESEQDFYSMFLTSKSPGAKHTSDARFIYPPDDSISDILYLIGRWLKGPKSDLNSTKLLSYVLCFQLDLNTSSDVPLDRLYSNPRTLILTEDHLVLAVEDHVSYPLPDFVRMPPAKQQMEIIEVRLLEFLRRVVLRSDDAHVIVLVFSNESQELIVDVSMEHFSSDLESSEPTPIPEVSWTLMIQNGRSRDKLIRVLTQQWAELHDGKQLTINTLP